MRKFISMQVIKLWFFILYGVIYLGISNVFAQTSGKSTIYYVALNGSDSNTGTTLDLPLATISRASELVKPGDRVLVRGGNYKIEQTIKIYSRGTAEEKIMISRYKDELPVLDFTALKKSGRSAQAVFFGSGTQFVVFEGFELVNGSMGIRLELSNHVTVRNCKLHDFDFVGISVGSDDCLIENNELYNICMAWENCNDKSGGWPQVVNTSSKPPIPPAMVSSHAMNNVFRGNYIHECWGEGIDPMFSNGVIVENNVIRDVFSVGIYMDGTRNAIIRNNFIYTTDNKRIRTMYNRLISGIEMGSEYFGGWSSYPAISHVENIYIYNNVLSRVGHGIEHWKDKNNTDRKNIYENVKIYNNTVDTYESKGDGIRFSTDLDFKTQGNECKNNIFRSSQNLEAEKGFIFENNLWVNGIPAKGNHLNSYQGDAGWVNPVPGGDINGYRLGKNSIFKDKGQAIKGLTTDKFGKKRVGVMSLGAIQFDGKVKGTNGVATSAVDDLKKQLAPDFLIGVNVALNPQFENLINNLPAEWKVQGDLDAFSITSPGHIVRSRNSSSSDKNSKTEYCVKLGKPSDYQVNFSQTLKNIPNGRYGLHVRVIRFGEGGMIYAETKDFGGETLICNLPLAKTMNEWADYSKSFFQLNISDIEVVNGQCTIGFFAIGSANDYALIDDVCFYRY
jgi:parallel beta-helix repeat protein